MRNRDRNNGDRNNDDIGTDNITYEPGATSILKVSLAKNVINILYLSRVTAEQGISQVKRGKIISWPPVSFSNNVRLHDSLNNYVFSVVKDKNVPRYKVFCRIA